MTDTAQYADTAWNSERYSNQKPRPEQGTLIKLLQGGDPLPWSRANEIVPVSMIQEPTPAEIKQRLKENKNETHWDEKELSIASLNSLSNAFYILSSLAKVACIVLLPISLISTLFLSIVDETIGFKEYIEIMIFFSQYIFLPSGLIWSYWELINRGISPPPFFMKAVKHFTFSRATGMVTRYKNNKELYSHPFPEFDCYLVSSPSHQGILSYQLHLVHRYHRYFDSIPLHTFSTSQQPDEFKRIWNMIQRYMDTSQPMPDIPELELARPRDPTTAAYDAKTNRKPDYWFTMDDDEFEEAINQLRAEQRFMPTQGPEINLFNGGTQA